MARGREKTSLSDRSHFPPLARLFNPEGVGATRRGVLLPEGLPPRATPLGFLKKPKES